MEIDKKTERIAKLEEVVDVQQEWLDIAQKHLSTVQKKSKMIAQEKDEQFEKLGGFCQESKRKLQQTQDPLQIGREEIAYLRTLVNLDTSFEAQINTTAVQDDAQAVNTTVVQEDSSSSTINTVTALVEKGAQYDEGATFIVTVKPKVKDLPECWGVRFSDRHLPGYIIRRPSSHQRGTHSKWNI